MNRPARLALSAIFAVLLLAAGWWIGRESAAPAAPDAGATADTRATGETRDESIGVRRDAGAAGAAAPAAPALPAPTVAAPTATPEPLPSPDTPVAEMLEPLFERARRGDTRAACRLASELQRCLESSRRMMDPQDMEARVAGENDAQRRESMITFMARMEVERERAGKTCAGLDDAAYALAFPLQLQAAQARPELRLWTALNPALDRQRFVGELERWQEYRQVAQPWLEAAAAEGDLSAIIALARVHGDDRRSSPPVPPYRELDEARFLTYATLLERYGLEVPPVRRAADEVRARMEPDALAAAERQADALFRPEAAIDAPDAGRAAMQRSFRPAPDAAACE
jgi:hypothetical protein